MLLFNLCALIFGISITYSFPHQGYGLRRPYPRQTMMFSGFYGGPNFPQGSMSTAMASETGAANTNSFSGNDYLSFFDEDESDVNFNQKIPELTEDRDETIGQEKPLKKKPQKPQIADEEEDDSYVKRGGSGNNPAYNAYFPIFFGGQGGGHSRGNDGYLGSGAPIAIANSYSTGKGGVATSHATAYGDPLLSMYLRNRNNKRKY